ncbi:MAG: Omp28-related outer membrane protein [Lentimicrobiaceae bacterium]|nr:Omp28-related outer membrane protein [Lentimicrobiaceae bacterium]
MKKIIFTLCVLTMGFGSLMAQSFVSTSPTNRNVILEEYTGRNCQYCPDGHLRANQIADANPGRFWAINIHAGSFSTTTYPNFQTPDGTAIHNVSGASAQGYPTGEISRETGCVNRGTWAGHTTTRLAQPSVVNLGGICTINPETRMATITVEIYYTGNSNTTTNNLTIAMLQSNVLGSQTGMNSNPAQVVNGTYNHMHVLRDIITDTWGDQVSPTTAGTFITKTYEYEIPEIIGDPNGVDVILEDLEFLIWIAEGQRTIITANELMTFVTGNTGAINPVMTGFTQTGGTLSCNNTKDATFSIINIGTDALTELKYEIEANGQTTNHIWEGTMNPFEGEQIPVQVTIPDGQHTVRLTLTEANGEALEPGVNTREASFEGSSWIEAPEATDGLLIKVRQDRYGNQTTWELLNGNMDVVASGGPYEILPAGQTKMHTATVALTQDECMKFVIYDSGGNGINNGNGEGNYQVEDAQGNVIFAGNGDFESEEATQFSIQAKEYVEIVVNDPTYGEVEIISGSLIPGEEVTVLAVPFEGFEFVEWKADGVQVSTDAEYTFIVPEEGKNVLLLEAIFRKTTDVDENYASKVKTYPNPVKDVLNISGVDNISEVTIYNLQGQLMLQTKQKTIDVSSLSKGIYFVQMNINETLINKKIVKE